MDKNLRLGAVHLCSGASFDRNGGVSALGIMSPSVGSVSFPLILKSLSVIGHVWNLSDKTIKGKLLIVPPKDQKDPFLPTPFMFTPTGKQGSVFVLQYPGVCFFEVEGNYGFEIGMEAGVRKKIHSLEIRRLPEQPSVPGLSPEAGKELQEEMKALVAKYLNKSKDKGSE